MKKFLTSLSLCLALTSTFVQESSAISLTGASEWAQPYVYAGITSNIVPDSLQNSYNSPITRADFCALAVATYETVTGSEIRTRYSFSDTTDINVEKMAGLGVVSGTSDTEFSPDVSINRQEAALILNHLSNSLGYTLPEATATFADAQDISDWARDAVGKVCQAEIMNGTGNDEFSPQNSYTKEQSILTLLKVFTMVSGADMNALVQEGQAYIAQNPVVETPVVTKSNSDLYNSVLTPLAHALHSNYNFNDLSSNNLSELYFYYNSYQVGYVFLDINSDGVDELLIAEMYAYTPNQLIALYYLNGETPTLAFNAAERVHFYLCSDGLIASTGSSGFDSTESCTYELTSNGMVLVNDSRTKNPYNITDPWNPNYSSISTLAMG